jgi:hypothetical protein
MQGACGGEHQRAEQNETSHHAPRLSIVSRLPSLHSAARRPMQQLARKAKGT